MSLESSPSHWRLLRACLFVPVIILLSLVGCYPVTSEGKVVGTYELATEQGKIVLDIRRDHTFVEKITFRNLPPEERSGKWKWTTGLDLDSLWIPSQFCPDYIVQADTRSGSNGTRYSGSGHWTIGPEWQFGHVTLPIFPDSNIAFRRTRAQ
jgi:hypothetical protein